MTADYGEAVVKRLDDGTVVVEHADDRIGVSAVLLADEGARYIDDAGLLVLDTAGEYRYRPVKFAPAVLPGREVTGRLKAAERCVLAVGHALTGELHDGVFDYDEAREHLLEVIRQRWAPLGVGGSTED